MCFTEMRTGRVWFWLIHGAALSAASIDFDPANVWPPLYSTTCLYFTVGFFFFLPCTSCSYSINTLLEKNKSIQFVN